MLRLGHKTAQFPYFLRARVGICKRNQLNAKEESLTWSGEVFQPGHNHSTLRIIYQEVAGVLANVTQRLKHSFKTGFLFQTMTYSNKSGDEKARAAYGRNYLDK